MKAGESGSKMDNRRAAALFTALTFIFGYSLQYLIYQKGGMKNPVSFRLLTQLMLFVPGLVALCLRLCVSKEGLKNSGLRIGKVRYYFFGWALAIAVVLAGFIFSSMTGASEFDFSRAALYAKFDTLGIEYSAGIDFWRLLLVFFTDLLFLSPLIGTLSTLSEEYGWRGYLTARLLPEGRLKALGITGVFWGAWHFPLILMGYNYYDQPIAGLPLMVVFTILAGIFLSWLYYASGSIFVPALARSVLNWASVTGTFFYTGHNSALAAPVGLAGLGVFLFFILILKTTGALDIIRPNPELD